MDIENHQISFPVSGNTKVALLPIHNNTSEIIVVPCLQMDRDTNTGMWQ